MSASSIFSKPRASRSGNKTNSYCDSPSTGISRCSRRWWPLCAASRTAAFATCSSTRALLEEGKSAPSPGFVKLRVSLKGRPSPLNSTALVCEEHPFVPPSAETLELLPAKGHYDLCFRLLRENPSIAPTEQMFSALVISLQSEDSTPSVLERARALNWPLPKTLPRPALGCDYYPQQVLVYLASIGYNDHTMLKFLIQLGDLRGIRWLLEAHPKPRLIDWRPRAALASTSTSSSLCDP